MTIINYGDNYEIYSNDLKTFERLPAATYRVSFNPMSGFSLVRIDNFETIEEKIYGNHLEKITKVLNSYDRFNRSLGVILSGNKGMGKSLFVQLLSKEAVDKGMPVIMVTKPFKGVAEFIDGIDQEALVIFDEFEKVFETKSEKGAETQNDLLGLFDGTSQKKRLYAITVNNLHRVSEFIVSRTGRFHYHLRFDYPTPDEIVVYLKDKLEEQYYHEIKRVVAFSNRVKLNYDSLRAIAFELNAGYSFGSAISDLNILTTDTQKYDVNIALSNGRVVKLLAQTLNLFNENVQISDWVEGEYFSVTFDSSSINTEGNKMLVHGNDVEFQTEDDATVLKDVAVMSVTIKHYAEPNVNYRLTV